MAYIVYAPVEEDSTSMCFLASFESEDEALEYVSGSEMTVEKQIMCGSTIVYSPTLGNIV